MLLKILNSSPLKKLIEDGKGQQHKQGGLGGRAQVTGERSLARRVHRRRSLPMPKLGRWVNANWET